MAPTKVFEPMLAWNKAYKLEEAPWPMLMSKKLDGIRAIGYEGELVSRSIKPIRNYKIQNTFGHPGFNGIDGELIIGSPTDHDVYRRTNSVVMSYEKLFQPDELTWYVFDDFTHPSWDYHRRFDELKQRVKCVAQVKVLEQTLVTNHVEATRLYEQWLEEGVEGAILRSPNSPYKFGRSTFREGYLLKLKPREDSEAIVLDIQEEMHNANEASQDAFGRVERSVSKENLIGKGTMGALYVRDLKTNVEFFIGTGFNAEDRQRLDWVGKVVKYSFTPVGIKDKPRHPVFHGERDKDDL